MDVRRINDRKLTARSDGNASTMQHAARSRVRRGLSANRFRIGRGPAHRAPATPHPPRPARYPPRTFAVVTPYDTPGSWHFAAVSVASDGFSAACASAAAPRPPSGTTTCNRTVARDRSRRTYAYTCRITSRVGADLSSRVLPKAKAEEHSQPTTVLSAIISRDSTWRRETFAPFFDLNGSSSLHTTARLHRVFQRGVSPPPMRTACIG